MFMKCFNVELPNTYNNITKNYNNFMTFHFNNGTYGRVDLC